MPPKGMWRCAQLTVFVDEINAQAGKKIGTFFWLRSFCRSPRLSKLALVAISGPECSGQLRAHSSTFSRER